MDATNNGERAREGFTLECEVPVRGRVVIIQMREGSRRLILCEVEITPAGRITFVVMQ